MSQEEQSMVDFKELREGMSRAGVYTLEQRIRHDGTGTFFSALTKDGERLLVKLVPAGDPEAEQQFAIWQRSRHLRHPHLLEVRDVGCSELAGHKHVYGVFEYPDDVLASALQQGPLSEPEARGVLEAALAALRYLHGEGLVHGAVTPEHIFAVGETVKLATDALRESDNPDGQAEDVRQLGELVRTLRAPERLTEPLASIARHATAQEAQQRWTLAEIARAIEPPPAVAPATPGMQVRVPSDRRGEADAGSPGAFPKWIFAGVGILLLAILAFNLRSKQDAAPVTPPVPIAAPATPPAPIAAPVTPPAPAASAPVAPPPRSTPPAASANWRVIAFTYPSREMAEKKAKQINDRWPDLHAAVFVPKGPRGYYLVALGDRMEREEAKRLQHKARSLGLPRDTYVQNYSE
jgi:hypothetical protein